MSKRRGNHIPLKVKEYERCIPPLDEYIEKEFKVGDDGYANIYLNEYDGMEWFDPMSGGDQSELNSDVYDYLDNKAFHIPADYMLRINVKGSKLSEDDKTKVKKMFREHYTLDLWEELENLKRNRFTYIGLAILGAILLIGAFSIDRAVYGDVISEMMMIVATFTFWEAADFFMLRRREINIQRLYAGQMATAEFVFE